MSAEVNESGGQMDFWLSWYSDIPLSEFELHSPWWVSGYDADDRTILVAAVRAKDEREAWLQVKGSYDDPPPSLDERFCEELDRSPFCGRFPKSAWMEWSPIATCACGCQDRTENGTELADR